MRKLLLIFLLIFSTSVFADTYPAIPVAGTNTAGSCGWVLLSGLSACEASYPSNVIWICSGSQCNSNGWALYTGYYPVYTCPAGGVVSGSSCINAPACTSPQTRNSTTGLCTSPPVVCTAGTQKALLTNQGVYPLDGSTPTFKLSKNQPISAAHPNPVTVDQGGCTYALPSNPYNSAVCHPGPSGDLFCEYIGTATGASVTTPDTAFDLNTTPTATPLRQNSCRLKFLKKIKFEIRDENLYKVF